MADLGPVGSRPPAGAGKAKAPGGAVPFGHGRRTTLARPKLRKASAGGSRSTYFLTTGRRSNTPSGGSSILVKRFESPSDTHRQSHGRIRGPGAAQDQALTFLGFVLGSAERQDRSLKLGFFTSFLVGKSTEAAPSQTLSGSTLGGQGTG